MKSKRQRLLGFRAPSPMTGIRPLEFLERRPTTLAISRLIKSNEAALTRADRIERSTRMDPPFVLLLLGLLCMAAMPLMMLFGGNRHWMDWYADRSASTFGDRPVTAREILDRRYARGEITKERYHAMIVDLDARAVTE